MIGSNANAATMGRASGDLKNAAIVDASVSCTTEPIPPRMSPSVHAVS